MQGSNLATLAIGAVLLPAEPASAEIRFTEVSVEAGVRRVHDPLGFVDGYGNPFQNGVGSGAAWVDINRDGWLDLVVTNGTTPGNFFFLNNGDGTFDDVSAAMGIRSQHVSNGIAVGDIDNDGFPDLFVANHLAEPEIYKGGQFNCSNQAASYGLKHMFFPAGEEPPGWEGPLSMGAAYGDYDKDGYLDVYIANFLFVQHVLLRNSQGGHFLNTRKVDVPELGHGCMPIFLDSDRDGDEDIFVVNDLGVDFLFRNEGPGSDWSFTEVAAATRIAGGIDPSKPLSMGMGVAAADFDQDQDLDIYVTNFRHNALWINPGDWSQPGTRFREVARERGVAFPLNSWGTDFFDVDHDGDLDLLMIGGWVEGGPDVQRRDIQNKLWLNNGPPAWDFTDVSVEAGLHDTQFGRSQAVGDYDRDGDLDVFVTNVSYYDPAPDGVTPPIEGHTLLYRNDTESSGHWINVRLQGGGVHEGTGYGCNRSAIGATLFVTAGGRTQMSVVQGGSGFMGTNSLEQEFGLGDATVVDRLRVEWICGDETVVEDIAVDRFYRLVEGETTLRPAPIAIERFEATPVPDGIRLDLWTPVAHDWTGALVFRGSEERDEPMRRIDLAGGRDAGHHTWTDLGVHPEATYQYRVVFRDDLGNSSVSATLHAKAGQASVPPSREVSLGQNFPNPFNPSTTLLFAVPRTMEVEIVLFDAAGRRVRSLMKGRVEAGEHRADWDGRDDACAPVAGGVYHYTLITEDGSRSRKMVLVR